MPDQQTMRVLLDVSGKLGTLEERCGGLAADMAELRASFAELRAKVDGLRRVDVGERAQRRRRTWAWQYGAGIVAGVLSQNVGHIWTAAMHRFGG